MGSEPKFMRAAWVSPGALITVLRLITIAHRFDPFDYGLDNVPSNYWVRDARSLGLTESQH